MEQSIAHFQGEGMSLEEAQLAAFKAKYMSGK